MNPFKPYDIRGIYPEEVGEQFAYSLGRTLGKFQNSIVVGIDSRIGSNKIKNYFIKGLLDEGAIVEYLGIVSTPIIYFSTKNRFNLGVMITASHNPKEYTGFKICDNLAIPLLPQEEIEKEFKMHPLPLEVPSTDGIAKKTTDEYSDLFINKLKAFREYNIVADFSNGSTLIERRILQQAFPNIKIINEAPDGNFPNHTPNALGKESTNQLTNLVIKTQSDIGIIFDGDGDRIGIIDEKGNEVRGDILTAIIAREILEHSKGKIIYDLRSSMIVPEIISEYGGVPIKIRVGHPFIKKKMRNEGALFAGEFSNHFYFKEIGGFESPLLALYYVLKSLEGISLSQEVKKLEKYFHSGEINLKIDDPVGGINKLLQLYKDKSIEKVDGATISDKDWWINARPSNTEPLLRVTAEASDKKTLNELIENVKDILLS